MTSTTVEIPGYIAGTWAIDPMHSHIGFVVRHVMVSKVRGRFTRFDGRLVTAPDLLDSTASATIEVASVDTDNAQRDEHLRSADFFDVTTYPTMSYRSTGLRTDGDGLVLDGELTLKGVTMAVPLRLEVNGFSHNPVGNVVAGFSATGELNRSDFGVSFNGPIPGSGGLVLGEQVQLVLEIEAIRQDDEPAE